MEMMNRKIVEANIQLQDKNNLLEEDKRILQSRIDKAIEYIEENCTDYFKENGEIEYSLIVTKNVLDILKGSDKE